MKMNFDPKKRALDELMAHLGKQDDEELSSALKPKDAEVAVTQVEASGDPEVAEEIVETGSSEPKLSDEEIAELIEALQAKLG